MSTNGLFVRSLRHAQKIMLGGKRNEVETPISDICTPRVLFYTPLRGALEVFAYLLRGACAYFFRSPRSLRLPDLEQVSELEVFAYL